MVYDRKICVRLSKQQYDFLKMLAEYEGVSISDALRSIINHAIVLFKAGYMILVEPSDENEKNKR